LKCLQWSAVCGGVRWCAVACGVRREHVSRCKATAFLHQSNWAYYVGGGALCSDSKLEMAMP
jgi:hypothetical protein